jgi:hypothetical protein
LLAFPDVPDLSCAAFCPDALRIHIAADNLGIFAVAKIYVAIGTNVAVTFAVSVSNFSAVASVQYLLLVFLLLLASLLMVTFRLVLQSCC